jgi:hypothetical protein
MMGNAALYDENSRLSLQLHNMSVENAQLKKALDILAAQFGFEADCPKGIGECEGPSIEVCAACLRDWALSEATE